MCMFLCKWELGGLVEFHISVCVEFTKSALLKMSQAKHRASGSVSKLAAKREDTMVTAQLRIGIN